MRLTGLARGGLSFSPDHKDFLLSNAERIAPFFKLALKLENVFHFVELDVEAQQMAQGVRQVKLVGRVQSAGQDRMRVDWRLKLGRRWLDPEDAERLAKAGRGTHVVRGLGLVKIAEEQSQALAEWRVAAASGSAAAQVWPRYMVFSLFAERGAELDLEDELQRWRAALEAEADDVQQLELLPLLRPYQAHGVRWMANLRRHACHGLLADEMGWVKPCRS